MLQDRYLQIILLNKIYSTYSLLCSLLKKNIKKKYQNYLIIGKVQQYFNSFK